MKKIQAYLIALLLLIIVLLVLHAVSSAKKVERLTNNQYTLLTKCDSFRTENGKYAIRVDALTLKSGEAEEYKKDIDSLAKELKIKTKRIKSYSKTSYESVYYIKDTIRDTVVLGKNLRYVKHKDNYIDMDAVIDGDSFRCDFVTFDTIRQVTHRIPKKFLFFRYGTKKIRQEMVSSNPHTRISYSEYIEIE